MNWSALDIVVVVVFTVQLIAWLFVLAALLRLKNGSVPRTLRHLGALRQSAQALAEASATTVARLKVRALHLASQARTIRKRCQVGESPAGMWIEPRHVRQAAGFVTLLRQRKTTPIKRKHRQVSLAKRLGLIPPALTRLAPLGKVARVAFQVLRQLRR